MKEMNWDTSGLSRVEGDCLDSGVVLREERIGMPNTEVEGEPEVGFLIDGGCEMVDLKRETAGLEMVRQRAAIGEKIISFL